MFPVKMIRYFFFFVERVGGGGREGGGKGGGSKNGAGPRTLSISHPIVITWVRIPILASPGLSFDWLFSCFYAFPSPHNTSVSEG